MSMENEFSDTDPIEQLPLVRKLPAASLFPMEIFDDHLKDLIAGLSRAVQIPESVSCQSVLGAISLASQPFRNVVVDGRDYPLSCYFMTIAGSGDRKSALDRLALRPHREWMREAWIQYQKDFKVHIAEMAKYEKLVSKLKEGENAPYPPEPPLKGGSTSSPLPRNMPRKAGTARLTPAPTPAPTNEPSAPNATPVPTSSPVVPA